MYVQTFELLFHFYVSPLLQAINWLLFLLVSLWEWGSKCRVNEAEIRIALWLHDVWFTSVCRLSSWKTLNSPEAGNQFNSTFCSQFRLCTKKISTFCTVWESLTCSRPISVLKFLHVYIIKSEIIRVHYTLYWTWGTGRIGVICDSKWRENFTADRTSRLYLL